MNLSKEFLPRLGKLKGKPKVVKPSPPPLEDRPREWLMMDLMFEGLRVRNERLNAITIELFGRFGDQPIRRLVLEAASRKNSVDYRLNLLKAITQIGKDPGTESYFDLCTLLSDPNVKIREAVAELLETLRQRRDGRSAVPTTH